MDFTDRAVDKEFYLGKITAVLQYRRKMGLEVTPETNVFRIVHAEG
ncbi:MAG: hypothetical protein R2744_04040 [Bacteroidales bacterium]